jgi:NAD-dependent deacetylase sirtuin 4
LNLGGGRGEVGFFGDLGENGTGKEGVRCSVNVEEVLPLVVKELEGMKR